MNERYITSLVALISKGIINPKTNQPFKSEDILDSAYRAEVEVRLTAQ